MAFAQNGQVSNSPARYNNTTPDGLRFTFHEFNAPTIAMDPIHIGSDIIFCREEFR